MMEFGFTVENDSERARLIAVIGRLAPEDMHRSLEEDGWSVSIALAHLAFWDRRARLLLERWEQGQAPPKDPDWYADVVNEALLPEWQALATGDASRLALEAAAAVDARVAGLKREVAEAILSADEAWLLRRSRHRREHLDEIERRLARA